MSKLLLAAVAVFGFVVMSNVARAADKTTVTGVLIDTKCGKGKDEAGATKHPAACCVKCADNGFEVISGDKHIKLDSASNAKAKEYLSKDKASTKVTIEGEMKGDTLAVSSIEAAK
jgi:hypothetical protein